MSDLGKVTKDAVRIEHTPNRDGGSTTKIEIDPSAKGAAAGAAAGAAVGSVVPVVGTVVGAAVGGLIGLIFGPKD